MTTRRLASGIGANAFGQLVNTVMQLSLVGVLAAHWGLERYGIWLMIFTIPSYLLVSDLGFGKACVVDMTMRAARGDKDGALATFQTTWALVLVVSAILIVSVVTICAILPDHVFSTSHTVPASQVRIAIMLMGTYGTLILTCMVFSGGFQASGLYPVEAITIACVWLLEGSSAMVTASLGGGLVAVAASYVICRLIGIFTYIVVLRRLAPWVKIGVSKANKADLRRLVGPATGMMAVPLANACLLQGTALAIGWALSAAAVPAFTTVRTLSRFGIQMIGIVTRASMPEFTMAHSRSERLHQVRLILLVVFSSAAVLLPIAAVLLLFGPKLVLIWTHGVVHASPTLIAIMAAVMLVNGFWTQLSSLIIAVNRQGSFTYYFMVFALLTTPVTYLLAPRFGAAAGGIAMLSVDIVMSVLVVRIVGRLFATPREIAMEAPGALRDMRGMLKKIVERLQRRRRAA